MSQITIDVKGMTCGGCARSLTRALEAVEGVAKAEVSFEQHTAVVDGEAEEAALAQAVKSAGFSVVSLKKG